ncbi:MAG: two-component sensor histidine kinase [Firmicutes bacterium HGW-Firmicutes-14]|nr:MAG: two-component sensor histidine kinase [Firmicutes bacterium HGW-Firmicutes-14]
MKMSVRTRLFLSTSGLIVFFVIFSLILNSLYLGKYYVWQKKQTLLESREMIEKLYKGDPEAIYFELENLERNRGINIYLLDQYMGLKYISGLRMFDGQYLRRPSERFPERLPLIQPVETELDKLPGGGVITDVVTDPRLRTKFVVLVSRLDSGEILMLSTPVAAINESTAVANKFFMFTGIITIILGGIAVLLFARRFTKPILKLNDIAQGMSRLDFSQKYPVQSDDEVGQLGRSINSLSDQLDRAISELQDANDKLREDIERERTLDKMRKEFVSNVSHELKTPLALIQGYAEGLKLNVNEDEENKDFYCDVIMDETNKMNRLVKDLLDLAQIESGQFKLEITMFDISSLVDRVLDKHRPLLSEKGIMVEVEKNKNVTVNGDVVRIEQVLVNFLNNAVNHVDDNKTVKITVTTLEDKVRVSVFNSGKTIPADSLDKIWTSFYKVDKARTRGYGGTGLGLSVVRAILELHGNAFGVENNESGVTFWFELDQADICSQNGHKQFL